MNLPPHGTGWRRPRRPLPKLLPRRSGHHLPFPLPEPGWRRPRRRCWIWMKAPSACSPPIREGFQRMGVAKRTPELSAAIPPGCPHAGVVGAGPASMGQGNHPGPRPGGPTESSPARERWVQSQNEKSPGRGDRFPSNPMTTLCPKGADPSDILMGRGGVIWQDHSASPKCQFYGTDLIAISTASASIMAQPVPLPSCPALRRTWKPATSSRRNITATGSPPSRRVTRRRLRPEHPQG